MEDHALLAATVIALAATREVLGGADHVTATHFEYGGDVERGTATCFERGGSYVQCAATHLQRGGFLLERAATLLERTATRLVLPRDDRPFANAHLEDPAVRET